MPDVAGTAPKGLWRQAGFAAAGGVGFDAFIWRGEPGPVLLVNGATHGDEYEGPTLLRTWAEHWRPRRLVGTVVFVPVLNEAAFFAGQRCAPVDGANLARVFPGQANGSPTERLAHRIMLDAAVADRLEHELLQRFAAARDLLVNVDEPL